MPEKKVRIIKIMLELTEDEYDQYFRIPKAEYKEKTDKYRSNTDTWRDQMAESKHYKVTGIQKSQRIEQQYTENLELKDTTKKYVENLKMKCDECGNESMTIKLDYDVMFGWKDKNET